MKRIFVETPFGRMTVRTSVSEDGGRRGEGSTKSPQILLLHGLPCDSRIWEPIAAGLGRIGALYAPDLPGFGETPPPPSDSEPLSALAASLAHCTGALSLERPTVIAHSMGGYVLLKALAEDLFECGDIILVSSRAAADTEEKRRERRSSAEELLRGERNGFVARQLEACGFEHPDAAPSLLRLQFYENATPSTARLLCSLADREDFTACLQARKEAVTLIVGSKDPGFLAEANRLAATCTGSRLYVLEGAGHVPFLDTPDAFVDAVARGLSREFSA